jgi:hypothetical protein
MKAVIAAWEVLVQRTNEPNFAAIKLGGQETYGGRGVDVLSEKDPLSLNDEEVDEFVDVSDHGVKSLSGDGVVLAGTDLGSQAAVQDRLSSNLGGHGDTENHPGKLESPSENIKIPNREDESDDSGISNGRGT